MRTLDMPPMMMILSLCKDGLLGSRPFDIHLAIAVIYVLPLWMLMMLPFSRLRSLRKVVVLETMGQHGRLLNREAD